MTPEPPMAAIESFRESRSLSQLGMFRAPLMELDLPRSGEPRPLVLRRHQLEPVSLRPARPLMPVAPYRTVSVGATSRHRALLTSLALAAETLHSHLLRNIVAVPNVVDAVPLDFVAAESRETFFSTNIAVTCYLMKHLTTSLPPGHLGSTCWHSQLPMALLGIRPRRLPDETTRVQE